MANLREAFDYAAQNPTSEFAQNLKQMAASGRLDEEAKKYGIDVSHFKPKVQPEMDLAQTGKNVLGGIAEGVGGIGLTAIQKGGEALVNRFGTDQMKQNVANAPSLQEQLAQNMGADRESTAFGVSRLGGNISATALPVAKVGGLVSGAAQGLGSGKVASSIARGATEGYLFDVGTRATEGNIDLTPGLGTAIGAGLPAAAPLIKGAGRLVQKAGEKTVGLATPTSAQEAQILQSYMAKKPFLSRMADVLSGSEKAPRTLAKTTAETTAGQTLPGIFGTKTGMGVQAKRASESLWKKVIEPKLEQSGKAVDVNGFFAKIGDDIVNSTDDITRQKSLLEALESVKEDYAGINSVSLPKLQKLKEGWAEFVPNKFYKGKDIAGSLGQVRALLAKEARDTIYNTLGDDVRTAYLDYGNLIGLQEMGQTAMTGAKLKGGAGSFIQELVSEAVTPIATIGGQILYRTGKGIEFIGNVGANTVGEAIGVGSSKKVAEHLGDTMKNSKLNRGIIELNPKNWFEEVGNSAEKYKSAEEFVDKVIPKNPNFRDIDPESIGIGTLNLEDIKSSWDADTFAKNRDIPIEENIVLLSEYKSKIKKIEKSPIGRQIDKPILVKKNINKGEGYRIYDGNHRYLQALKNGDTQIPVVFLDNSGGVKLTDIYNKANKNKYLNFSQKSEVKYSKPDLASEAKKYKSAEEFVKAQPNIAEYSPLTDQTTQRSIKILNESGIPVKSGKDILTLYHGTNEKGMKGINESGTLNSFSYLATDKNASKGFAFGKGGGVLEIKVPVKDAGFVQQSMAGAKGATIQNPVKLIKGEDGIWRAEQWKTKAELEDIWNKANKK